MKHKLYKYLTYNILLRYIPYEDIMQELSIVEYLYSDFTIARRAAVNALYRLAADYGFSRKKGKDNFAAFYNTVELTEEENKVIDDIECLYIYKNFTAREIAQIYNIEFNNKFAKILNQLFPKNMGLGGKRKNSGRKKKTI